MQGFSHKNSDFMTQWHRSDKAQPTVLSECCSCTSHRLPISARSPGSGCMAKENSPGLLPFSSGSLGVWTLFDYFGESHTWYVCTHCSRFVFVRTDFRWSKKPQTPLFSFLSSFSLGNLRLALSLNICVCLAVDTSSEGPIMLVHSVSLTLPGRRSRTPGGML